MYIEKINGPEDVKKLNIEQLSQKKCVMHY